MNQCDDLACIQEAQFIFLLGSWQKCFEFNGFWCSQFVPIKFSMCSYQILNAFPICSKVVNVFPELFPPSFPSSFLCIYIKFPMYSQYVLKLSMCSSSYSHHIPIEFSTCSHQILDAFPICSHVVNVFPNLFPPNSHQVFNVFTSNFQCIPNMFPSCPWVYQDVPNSTTLHLITFGQSWNFIMYIGEAFL